MKLISGFFLIIVGLSLLDANNASNVGLEAVKIAFEEKSIADLFIHRIYHRCLSFLPVKKCSQMYKVVNKMLAKLTSPHHPPKYNSRQVLKIMSNANICFECRILANGLPGLITDNNTLQAVGKKLDKACELIPHYQQECKNWVYFNTPDLMQSLASDFNTQIFCYYLRLCSSPITSKSNKSSDFKLYQQ